MQKGSNFLNNILVFGLVLHGFWFSGGCDLESLGKRFEFEFEFEFRFEFEFKFGFTMTLTKTEPVVESSARTGGIALLPYR